MTKIRSAMTALAVIGLLGAPSLATAQTQNQPAQHVPLQKTIGQAGPGVVPSLIVMNSKGASLQGGKLTLLGIAPNSIVFADRPVRAAGHALTTHLLEEWGTGNESFAADPPNATVSVFSKDGSAVRDAVVVLKTPKLEGDRLTFDVAVLEGDLAGADGPASIFIDRFGFGFGGVGRPGVGVGGIGRPGFGVGGVGRWGAGVGHAAWYRGAGYGAAALGGAAIGAAAASAYYRPPCGYYPYPPCY